MNILNVMVVNEGEAKRQYLKLDDVLVMILQNNLNR